MEARMNNTNHSSKKQNRPKAGSSYSGLIIGAVGTIIVLTLLGMAIMHALVAETQSDINKVEKSLEIAREEQRNLESSLAVATAPENIVSVAKEKLGMITPTTVIYVSGSQNAPEN